MCLAIPAKILTVDGTAATVDMGGNTTSTDISMVPTAKVGDYVLIHAGLAIQVYDEKEAQETLDALRELAEITRKPS